jgi:hypothetical protein
MNARASILVVAIGFAATLTPNLAFGQSLYKVVDVPDGGVISGTVKWSGPHPKALTIPITKDQSVCDPDHTAVRDLERLEISADGGVANTVVFLRGITQGKNWDLPEARRHLDQKLCRYVPHVTLVEEGKDLEIQSHDHVLHTVHMTGAASYNLPFPMQDQSITPAMNKGGVVDLKCNAGHIWMNGIVIVVNHPYYAVTDEHGDFRITGVPPGEYEIIAWHEGWKVSHEASVLDVAAQTQTKRLFFSDPESWEKKVSVSAGGRSTVDFEMSESR